jgi:phosphoribosylformimino-5-aminoimidazole carboxamide ribonucleotide (ProFAR) isomerase
LSTKIPVIASGGVSSLDDVRILAEIPELGGIITGKAVYEGCFTVEQAVAALRDVNLGSGGAQ